GIITPDESPTLTSPLGPPTFEAAPTTVRHGSWALDDETRSSRAAIREELVAVIQFEGPILAERLARIVAARFDLSRVREGRRRQILTHAPRGLARQAPNGDVVYWQE